MDAPRRKTDTTRGPLGPRRLSGLVAAVIVGLIAVLAIPAGAEEDTDLVLINGLSPADIGFEVSIDARLDGECVVVGLEFADVTFGINAEPGRHDLAILASDGACGGQALVETSVDLEAGEDTTSITHLGDGDQAVLTTFTDNTTGLGRNRGRATFTNLSSAPALDVGINRSGRDEVAVGLLDIGRSEQATGETWIGSHDVRIAEAGEAPFFAAEIELDQNAVISLYGVGQSVETFTVIQNRRPTGEDPGVNGVFVTVENTYVLDGPDSEVFTFGNATAGRVGPGIEAPTSRSDMTYDIDVAGDGISLVWDRTSPAIDELEGVLPDGVIDTYRFTFAEPVLAGLTATASPDASLVPDVDIVSDTELVVSTAGGTEIGDGFDARIVFRRGAVLDEMIPIQPDVGLDGVFVTVSSVFRVDADGDDIPFGNATAARVGPGVEIDPARSGFEYEIDVDTNSVSFVWDVTNPELDVLEGVLAEGRSDVYILTFAEPVLADLRARPDQTATLVPNAEVISDTQLVVVVPGGSEVGDGFDARIELID